MKQYNRKEFLMKSIVLSTTLSLVMGESVLFGKEKKKENQSFPLPEGLTQVAENDPTAQALGFHHNANDTDYTLFPDRKLPNAKNQICQHCSQFTKLNEGWGKCNILTAGVVSNLGWCSAWSKKS
ncbi:high-potential iron-sulfur protein [Leptospira jelokensis]|uniref:High-potential iron-sulfur protein n=2 Tax=Leptospira jelokensis TaxID=2484931 RepID=A0A4Z1A8C5_9LEPT|nr:high-potential iron-sulfur protein [Leptospira jelokensis]TGL75665.1 high-potential iron-sulfur protein [Leptospira jelokensis]